MKKGKKIKSLIIILIITTMIFLINKKINAYDMTWIEWQNEDYWEWHTRTTTSDMSYNGRHIEIENDVIYFYGYGVISYKDFLYKEYTDPGQKKFEFTIDESRADYHTLDGAGFIFNASIDNNTFSGYMLSFEKNSISLYRLENVNVYTFENTSNTTIGTYGTLIKRVSKTSSGIHNLVVEASPANVNVYEENTQLMNIDLSSYRHIGEGFGVFSSYLQHGCSVLTKIEFSNLKVIIEDYGGDIVNINKDNEVLEGGEFEIKNEDGTILKTGKTNNKGILSVNGLARGNYTIKQIVPPLGYKLNSNTYQIFVTEGGKVINPDTEEDGIIIPNEDLNFEIKNKEKDTEKDISGSKIALYDEYKTHIATATTDLEGNAKFFRIPAGTYTFKQLGCPDKYNLNSKSYKIIINQDGTIEFEKNNNGIIYNTIKEIEIIEEQEELKEQEEKEIIEEIKEEVKKKIVNNTTYEKDVKIVKPTTSEVQDNTLSKKIIPYTGNKIIIAFYVFGLIILGTGIYTIIWIRKYKNI